VLLIYICGRLKVGASKSPPAASPKPLPAMLKSVTANKKEKAKNRKDTRPTIERKCVPLCRIIDIGIA
jgi:hypothetical protein